MRIMDLALYDAQYGYYSGKPRRIGRQGDFYTAVSVGPLYGRLLAEQAVRVWEAGGRAGKFVLAEQAAHDGQLMEDMLTEIQARHGGLAEVLEVVLIEPKGEYRAAQEDRLRRMWRGGLRWIAGVGELEGEAGLLVCNELLDALPVHRVILKSGRWRELGVALEGEGTGLAWEEREIEEEALAREAAELPAELPEGHVTEIQLAAAGWVRELGGSGFRGTVWVADYGMEAEDYFSVERREGTLRRYWRHRMDDRVLEDLGEADLTCHVNFTRVREAAEACGLRVVGEAEQGRMLTRLAGRWLESFEGKPPGAEGAALLRQFQSLTHPGIMGRAFRVLVMERAEGRG
jgi:SAM-dependent MidA family methyltransferase